MSLKIDSNICPILKLFISSFLAFFIWMKNTFLLCYGLGGWGGRGFFTISCFLVLLGLRQNQKSKEQSVCKSSMVERSLNSWTPAGDKKLTRQVALLRVSAQLPGTEAGWMHSGDGLREETFRYLSNMQPNNLRFACHLSRRMFQKGIK